MRRSTYSGNFPLHLATYSFLTSPLTNSCESVFASAELSGRIIMPDVNLSSRLMAKFRSVNTTLVYRCRVVTYYTPFRTQSRSSKSPPDCCGSIAQQHAPAVRKVTTVKGGS